MSVPDARVEQGLVAQAELVLRRQVRVRALEVPQLAEFDLEMLDVPPVPMSSRVAVLASDWDVALRSHGEFGLDAAFRSHAGWRSDVELLSLLNSVLKPRWLVD